MNQERFHLTDLGGSGPIPGPPVLMLLPSWLAHGSPDPTLSMPGRQTGSVFFPLLSTEVPGQSFGLTWFARVPGGLGSTRKHVGLLRRGPSYPAQHLE